MHQFCIVTYNHTKDCMDDEGKKKQESTTNAEYFLLLPPPLKFFICIQWAIGLHLHLKNRKFTLWRKTLISMFYCIWLQWKCLLGLSDWGNIRITVSVPYGRNNNILSVLRGSLFSPWWKSAYVKMLLEQKAWKDAQYSQLPAKSAVRPPAFVHLLEASTLEARLLALVDATPAISALPATVVTDEL